MPVRRLLLCFFLVFATGCQGSSSQAGFEVTRIANIVMDAGTTRIFGSARLSSRILDGASASTDQAFLAGAKVRLVNALGAAINNTLETKTDQAGFFSFSQAPIGVPMAIEITYEKAGRTVVLHKYLRPLESITCAHVDLATTLVTDKLMSLHPLAKEDSGFSGSEVFELADPIKLEAVEAEVRKALPLAAFDPNVVADRLAGGGASTLFESLVVLVPQVASNYQSSFELPDASLGVRIMATGRNRAVIRGVEQRKVFGLLRVRTNDAPKDTIRMDYFLNDKLVAQSSTDGWESQIDTWQVPNGPYTLKAIAVQKNGSKSTAVQIFMDINNTHEVYCPLPES